MCPAVPTITSAPSLVLPDLERTKWPAVAEVLAEELAQQPLVCPPRRVVHPARRSPADPVGDRLPRPVRKDAARRLEARASRADEPTGGVAEHHRAAALDRRVAAAADVQRRREAELRDEP